MALIDQIVTDAAAPLAETMKGVEALGINAIDLTIRYRRNAVMVTLTGEASERAEVVWELLILEFRHAGWGFHTRFDNGIDQPRTAMSFDHPSTLTRVG